MRDDAATTRMLYFVEPQEFVRLKGFEPDVLSVLSTNQVEGCVTWVNKTDTAKTRFVQLWVATESQSTFLLEWQASELGTLSAEALRAHLADQSRSC